MKSILLIIPYFGKWPVWFDAHLVSIAANPTINWLCPTDCDIPKKHPNNIKFLPINLKNLNAHVNTIVNANVPLSPRKFCDLKPAYGDIFSNEVEEYDFWGFCDMDIIWGDIRSFITEEMLLKYDIISSRKKAISGHFTLFKNNDYLNNNYKSVNNYKALFEQNHINFDEFVLTKHFKESENSEKINIYWPKILCNQESGRDSHQEYYLDKWLWNNGKVLDISNNVEAMYLHFINWKRTMNYNEIIYDENPSHFYISYNGIHYKQHAKLKKALNRFKNIFNGYWIKEKRRYKKLKFISLKKRINHKLR